MHNVLNHRVSQGKFMQLILVTTPTTSFLFLQESKLVWGNHIRSFRLFILLELWWLWSSGFLLFLFTGPSAFLSPIPISAVIFAIVLPVTIISFAPAIIPPVITPIPVITRGRPPIITPVPIVTRGRTPVVTPFPIISSSIIPPVSVISPIPVISAAIISSISVISPIPIIPSIIPRRSPVISLVSILSSAWWSICTTSCWLRISFFSSPSTLHSWFLSFSLPLLLLVSILANSHLGKLILHLLLSLSRVHRLGSTKDAGCTRFVLPCLLLPCLLFFLFLQ